MVDVFDNLFGVYLWDCCEKFDLVVFGLLVMCCCMLGLWCEEVVQCVYVSVVWYMWFEQGCGGVLLVDVFDWFVCVLMFNEVECEYLFLIGFGYLFEVCYYVLVGVMLCLQYVFDLFDVSFVIICIVMWDVVVWNDVVVVMFIDYVMFLLVVCNILWLIFVDVGVCYVQLDWECVVWFVVGGFCVDVVCSGVMQVVQVFVDEMCVISVEFDVMWCDYDICMYEEVMKEICYL